MGEKSDSSKKTVAEVLDDAELDKLLVEIRKLAVEGSNKVTNALKAIFHGSPPSQNSSSNRRLETFKFTLNLFQTVELSSSVITELLTMLMNEIDRCQTSLLLKIAEYLLSQIKDYEGSNSNWLEIFPILLRTLSERDSIVFQGKDMSGKDLKNYIILSLCEMQLRPQSTMQLIPMLKGVDLTNDEIKLLIDTMLSTLHQLKYQELPSYVYQLLHFPAKTYKKSVLRGIVMYFVDEDQKLTSVNNEDSDQDKSKWEIFHQIEGSVVVMIQLSCKQDRDLGAEFILILKSLQYSPATALSSFIFSIAMSLCCIQRFQEPVLNLLKDIITHSFRNKEKCHHSVWIRTLFPDSINVVELVKKAITSSKEGWDHISQGLIKFGFILLDKYGPKLVFGKAPNASRPHTLTVSEQACSLGSIVLRRTFWGHHTVRSEVFEQILSRVVTKSNSPVSHYINVLSGTVQGDPQLLLEILTKVIEILDYLPFLPYYNAVGILNALTPLLKISMPLKDALMLVLRKSLFHRDVEPRKIAITGYLTILKKINAKGKMSLSQSQCSYNSQSSSISSVLTVQSDSSTAATNSKTMCLEIMGILKRTFIHQAEIKQLLYEGLYNVIVKKPDFGNIVLELLLDQFENFLRESDDPEFPLDVLSCITVTNEDAVLAEPIAHLITSIYLILFEIKKYDNDEDLDMEADQNPRIILENALKSITAKIAEGDVEFDLGKKTTDEALSSDKKELSLLLMSVYESLMEFSSMNNMDFSENGCAEMLSLFKKYKKIADISQGKKLSKLSKNKGSLPQRRSHVTIKFVTYAIEALFSDDNPAHHNGIKLLRSDNSFVKYILNTCDEKLVLYNEVGKIDGFSENMEKTFDYICIIARIFLKNYSSADLDDFPSLEMEEIKHFFIDGLNLIFSYMFSSNNEHHDKFISEVAKDLEPTNVAIPLRVLKKFQKLTIDFLSDTDEDKNLKEVIPLLSVIEHLSTMPSVIQDNVYEWSKQLCKEQTFKDISISKKLLSLCLGLSHQTMDGLILMLDIAQDIHHHLGDIDPDINVRERETYSVINAHTSSSSMHILIHHIEQILNEIEWALNVLKNPNNSTVNINGDLDNKQKEKTICEMLLNLIKVFHEIVQTAVPVGAISNELLKAVTTLYKCFTMLCKYYVSLYDKKDGHLDPMFVKMVKFSGTQLTAQVYSFITYIQAAEVENNKNKKTKGIKSVRDVKTIPPLIFAIELYERHLIGLSKKSKTNLMSHMKVSTSRDFRINPAAVIAAEEDDEAADNENEREVMSTITLSNGNNHSSSDRSSESGTKRSAEQRLSKGRKRQKKS